MTVIAIAQPDIAALNAALNGVKQAKFNAINLADPEVALEQAQMAWMQAVVDALTALANLSSSNPIGEPVVLASAASPEPSAAPTADAIAALQAQEADLQAKVAAGQAALAAFDAVLHPAADAAPSSTEPPAIAPTNAGV